MRTMPTKGKGFPRMGRPSRTRFGVNRMSIVRLPRRKEAAADEEIKIHEDEDEVEIKEDIWSRRNHIHITPNFLKRELAQSLRQTFDSNFKDPKKTHSAR